MSKKKYVSRLTKAFGVSLGFLFLLSGPAMAQQQEEVNTIKSIKTVPEGIEIELYSTREFPVRNEIVRLHIGDDEFTRSRSPEDGSLNTLFFTLTVSAFETRVATGDRVWVDFGEGSQRWDFGTLDKSLLGKSK